MKTNVRFWTIRDLLGNAQSIELTPAYQRGPAWRPDKQALLLDSVFRNYDLPKIYLAAKGAALPPKYEVIDGQQRVRAIFGFANETLSVPSDSLGRNAASGTLNFSELRPQEAKRFMDFKLTVTIITGASPTFKRTLFERLQLGERLNSAELRNALPSSAPRELRAIAISHPFFSSAGIKDSRYKREDYLTHIFAYVHLSRSSKWKDIKAPTLRKFILDSARGLNQNDQRLVDDILNFLHQVTLSSQKVLRNKWTFVDTALYCLTNKDELSDINPIDFVRSLSRIEKIRKSYYQSPEVLLDSSCRVPHKRELYNYINAYKSGTALKTSLQARQAYLKKALG